MHLHNDVVKIQLNYHQHEQTSVIFGRPLLTKEQTRTRKNSVTFIQQPRKMLIFTEKCTRYKARVSFSSTVFGLELFSFR